ncbi:MAG: DNA primase, partial [Staphylococcus sp.]|nr:DNA primase [Staphylococcus sp.]
MSKKAIFQKYPYTIRLEAKNNTMVPVQKFNKEKYEGQDVKLQEIVPYIENQRKTDNVGLLMNRLLVIDLDVGHQEDVDGREVFRNWIHSKDKTDIQSRMIAEDINNTMRVRTPGGGL